MDQRRLWASVCVNVCMCVWEQGLSKRSCSSHPCYSSSFFPCSDFPTARSGTLRNIPNYLWHPSLNPPHICAHTHRYIQSDTASTPPDVSSLGVKVNHQVKGREQKREIFERPCPQHWNGTGGPNPTQDNWEKILFILQQDISSLKLNPIRFIKAAKAD